MQMTQRERSLSVALSAATHFIEGKNFVDAREALKFAEKGYQQINKERYPWMTKKSSQSIT